MNYIDKLIHWCGQGIKHVERGPNWIYWLITPWMIVFLTVAITLALPIAIVGHLLKPRKAGEKR